MGKSKWKIRISLNAICVMLFFCMLTVGCGNKEKNPDYVTFTGDVKEMNGNTITVQPMEEEMLRSSDLINVGFPEGQEIDVNVGDTVEIWFDGMIMETYPAKINAVSYKIIKEAVSEEELQKSEQFPEEIVTYDSENAFMQISVPGSWNYEILTPDMVQDEEFAVVKIEIQSADNPDISFALVYYNSFGICGTGVTAEAIMLDSGLSATKYTEIIEDEIWLTVCIKSEKQSMENTGAYVAQGIFNESSWKQYENEILEMINSIIVQ